MPKDTEKTIVIFRKDPGGDVLACFPCLPGTPNPTTCLCYAHVGQHSAMDAILIQRGLAHASPEEYRDLKRELEGLGYNLTVKTRSHSSYYHQRRRALGLPTY